MKPHGRDCPDRCSQCQQAPARRVDQVGPDLVIDGEALRPINPPTEPYVQRPRRQRGKR